MASSSVGYELGRVSKRGPRPLATSPPSVVHDDAAQLLVPARRGGGRGAASCTTDGGAAAHRTAASWDEELLDRTAGARLLWPGRSEPSFHPYVQSCSATSVPIGNGMSCGPESMRDDERLKK